MSLSDFFRQLVLDRSFRGWRTVRPSLREVVVTICCLAVVVYALLVFGSVVTNKCAFRWTSDGCNGSVDEHK